MSGLAKKLINFGWDMPSPRDLAKNVGALQHLPFDGLTVRALNFCYTFYNRQVDEAAVDEHVAAMAAIEWGQFTDNFLWMVTGDQVDWFDESAWGDAGYILANVRAIARMGRAGGCRGILFDPEFVYWGQPGDSWNYRTQASRKEKSIAEYRAMVRRRGAQFIGAIEEYMPAAVLLTLFWGIKYTPAGQIAADPGAADQIIVDAPHYGLLHDFMLGILAGAGQGTTIVDGNEASYYTWDAEGYEAARRFIRQTMPAAVPEELRPKYRAQVAVGHAVYADVHSNTRPQHEHSTYMTPAERALAMEWVVYHAMASSDQYVWFYTEKPRYLDDVLVASELPPAVAGGRRKVVDGESIGFDLRPIRERADQAFKEAQFAPVEPLQAAVRRAASAPKIDGDLGDVLWQEATGLGPFLNFRTAIMPLHTSTLAYMAYDENKLYIAVHCLDPAMDEIRVGPIAQTEGEVISAGSMVQIALAADEAVSKYYYIVVGYDNQRWDALTPAGAWPEEIGGEHSSWDGEYEHATQVDETSWSVEMAIPWSSLHRQAPRAGEGIKGNIRLCAGRRQPQNQNEFSSWSPMVLPRNIEARTFGTWTFE